MYQKRIINHGTNVWADNQREKLLDKREAYQIMESVRRGKGLTAEMIQNMKSVGISGWYIDVCKKIRYLFPRAHAVSYALLAWRTAYYKVHFPNEYEQALSIVPC